MKTILILVGGMADLPDPLLDNKTPLMLADTPSLDVIAKNGIAGTFSPLAPGKALSVKNSLMSVLGFDLNKNLPSEGALMEFGMERDMAPTSPNLPFMVLPGFSGHGVSVTSSPLARGISKLLLLNPVDIYVPGNTEEHILDIYSRLTISAISRREFVLIYIDTPRKAALAGDYEAKIRSLSLIDRLLISPVADYMWHSREFINLAVVSPTLTSWRRRKDVAGEVPAVVYFNDAEIGGNKDFNENLNPLSDFLDSDPGALIRFLCNFSPENNPFPDERPEEDI